MSQVLKVEAHVNLPGLKNAKKALTKELKDGLQKIKKRRVQALKASAPAHTGLLASGIYGRISQKKTAQGASHEVSLRIADQRGPTGFPYARWVTNQQGFETIKPQANNRFFRGGQTVAYGDGSVSPSGRQISWTGQAGFWQTNERLLAEDVRRLKKEIEKKIGKG